MNGLAVRLVLFALVAALAACGTSPRDLCDASSCAGTCDADGLCVLTPAASECAVAADCPSYACSCGTGVWNSRRCENGSCSSESVTCAAICADHGGLADGHTTTPPPPPPSRRWGCSLARFSNDFSVTVRYFGSGTSDVTARNAAHAQCLDGDFTEAFCAGAVATCAREDDVPSSCEFTRWSDSQGSMIHYWGAGSGLSGASADAVASCLTTGNWSGWFCGAGTVSCSAD